MTLEEDEDRITRVKLGRKPLPPPEEIQHKRDRMTMATAVLAGMCASADNDWSPWIPEQQQKAAYMATNLADALLKELEK